MTTIEKSEFAAFACDVAAALGGQITRRNEDGDYVDIALSDVTIDLYVSRNYADRNKPIVVVGLPVLRWRDAEGNDQTAIARDSLAYNERDKVTLQIKASMTRGAVAVAKDITRRLLPQARIVWAKMLARRDSAMAYAGQTVATREALAFTLGVEPRGNTLYVDGATLTVQGNSVRFERLSNVSLETALKMVALLKAQGEAE